MSFSVLVLRNLLRQRVRTLLTALGIGIGVATVVALGAITSGLKGTMGELVKTGGADFMVAQAGASDLSFSAVSERDVRAIAARPDVARATGMQLEVADVGSNPYFMVFGYALGDLPGEGLTLISPNTVVSVRVRAWRPSAGKSVPPIGVIPDDASVAPGDDRWDERIGMALSTARIDEPPAWLGTLFDRIVCGIDGTESSRVAVEQAARLLPARRTLELVSVVDQRLVVTSTERPDAEDVERRFEEARRALRKACAHHPSAWSRLLSGDPGPELLSAVRETKATLAVVGAPPSGRLGTIVLGAVGTQLLRSSPCSVLIVRPSSDEGAFPRSIVVGHDGSRGAAAAAAVAKELAHRFDAGLRILVAEGGGPAQVDRLAQEGLEWSFLPPVEALATASAEADLLVVGSYGLRGVRTLGSVSERIAHLARCSVLVVREPPGFASANRDDDAVPDIEC